MNNGAGATASTNGYGNLVIGYNEDIDGPFARTGSHNLVVGPEHNWTSYGGLIAGYKITVRGAYSSVSGGVYNTANGDYSTVSGGYYNTASGGTSSVSGGYYNTASGDLSSVSGGENTFRGASGRTRRSRFWQLRQMRLPMRTESSKSLRSSLSATYSTHIMK